jgi:hypothetical protein
VDTRSKILDPDKALEVARRHRSEGKRLKVVVGHFDPVLASHARRISSLSGGSTVLMAIVVDPPKPILAAVARAELVAALAAVNYVAIPGETSLESFLARLGAAEVVRAENADRELTRDLIQHVQSRSKKS